MQWKDFTHQPQINTSSLFCILWKAMNWELRNNKEFLPAPASGYLKHAGSYSMEILNFQGLVKSWAGSRQWGGSKGNNCPKPKWLQKEANTSWLVTWSKGTKNSEVCSSFCIDRSPEHQGRKKKKKKTDTEDTEEPDKLHESYHVKVTFEIPRLIHIHMEDTWKAGI